MPTTSNFGWTTPADTDLVKDGAAAIRTLGNGIDTSLVDLKGGTTGQVLSKNSNTDLDFTWVAQDDSNAIQNAIVDAKGDLISATAADTPARLASSGVNGDVLTVDTSTATGLKWATAASGSMTLISTTTLTGASVTLSSIPQTYTDLRLVLINPLPATDGAFLQLQYNGVTTGVYAGSTNVYYWSNVYPLSSGNTTLDFAGSNPLDNSVSNNQIVHIIQDYTNSVSYKTIQTYAIQRDQTTAGYYFGGPYPNAYFQTTAISSILLKMSSGNFTSGTAYLYGVK